ncbi:MAG: Gfo/Idh/MocA family oxidoreductase [Kiritimatiellae bacterium]|nr:Gfo/Idh/MocA family oxidoreductase [Kiritimatiellia bacterium]
MKKEKPFRVGVIGAGMIAGAAHIPAWKNLAGQVELVALADRCVERARLLAQKEGIPAVYGEWQELLEKAEPDIVSVCTPNAYHKEQTIGALRAGAHVLCEKAVATNHADAAAMYETAEAESRILFAGQSSRFSGRSLAARELAAEGRLGEIYFADTCSMRRRGIPTWGQFHMKAHSGAGPIFDFGSHQMDLLLWIMGNPRVRAVTAAVFTKIGNRPENLATSLAESGAPLGVLMPRPYAQAEFDVEDMATAFVRLEGGGVISMRLSWAANIPANMHSLMILGTEGGLTADPLVLSCNTGRYKSNISPQVPADRNVPFSGHWLETEHFVKVLRGEEALVVRKEEVLNATRALEAISLSAQAGREIVFEEEDEPSCRRHIA